MKSQKIFDQEYCKLTDPPEILSRSPGVRLCAAEIKQKISPAVGEAAFYEYLTGVLTQEEAAAFAAVLNKLYTASKTESRAGFPHFRNTAGGETARGTTD